MEQLKFTLGSIIVLGIVGFVGYWAVTTMQSGSQHVNTEKIRALQIQNEDLQKQVATLNSALAERQAKIDTTETPAPQPATSQTTKPVTPTTKPATTVYKNQTLINELQKLANANVLLKLKSAGSSVGTVEKFLNIYNKTSNKIDNDYGASTKAAVAAFQKAQGITVSGDTGSTTLKKMIDWLKKQG